MERQGKGFTLKERPYPRFLSLAGPLFGALLASGADAEPLRFALVAKRVDHPFFIQAGEGCAEAARAQGDTCLLLGAAGPTHFRRQNQALEQALDMGLDGIALSVTHSQWLADHALKRASRTPLITFDSDLGPAERHLRLGYVGLDNQLFGRRLARLAQHFRPQGGRLCILSGNLQDTNLQERLQGIRRQLGAARDGDRLDGENGWRELNRCPLYSSDDQQTALLQLATLLDGNSVDVVISIAAWPSLQAATFRQRLGELGEHVSHPVIIMTTNEPDAAQLELLDEGLVQAYLDIDSREMGRQSYWMLKRLAQGKTVPKDLLIDDRVVYLYLSGSSSPPDRPPATEP